MKKTIPLLFLIILVITAVACDKAETYQTTDVAEYLQIGNHITNEGFDIRSGLFIFPETIQENNNAEYKYYCKQGPLDNSYMIFLKNSYLDAISYESELNRLNNISCTVETIQGTVVNEIEYTTTLFDYPAYVAIYNTNNSFEYALADDENQCIIYVYLKMCEGRDFLPKEYLPKEFQESTMMEYDTSWENQNIYYAPEENGDYIYYLD